VDGSNIFRERVCRKKTSQPKGWLRANCSLTKRQFVHKVRKTTPVISAGKITIPTKSRVAATVPRLNRSVYSEGRCTKQQRIYVSAIHRPKTLVGSLFGSSACVRLWIYSLEIHTFRRPTSRIL
jgi:hypothetical protein